jgi:hypothetical protein
MVCNHLHTYDTLRTKPYNGVPKLSCQSWATMVHFWTKVGSIAPQPKGKVEKCNRLTTHMPLASQAQDTIQYPILSTPSPHPWQTSGVGCWGGVWAWGGARPIPSRHLSNLGCWDERFKISWKFVMWLGWHGFATLELGSWDKCLNLMKILLTWTLWDQTEKTKIYYIVVVVVVSSAGLKSLCQQNLTLEWNEKTKNLSS